VENVSVKSLPERPRTCLANLHRRGLATTDLCQHGQPQTTNYIEDPYLSTDIEVRLENSMVCWLETTVNNTHTHTTVLRPFFWDHLGEPVTEENFWTLWCKGRLTEADTQTIRLGATPSGPTSAHLHHPPIFYRPNADALPDAQPTVSKHWRQLVHLARDKTLEFSSTVLPAPFPYHSEQRTYK